MNDLARQSINLPKISPARSRSEGISNIKALDGVTYLVIADAYRAARQEANDWPYGSDAQWADEAGVQRSDTSVLSRLYEAGELDASNSWPEAKHAVRNLPPKDGRSTRATVRVNGGEPVEADVIPPNDGRQEKDFGYLVPPEAQEPEQDWITLEEWKAGKRFDLAGKSNKHFNKQDTTSIEWAQWSWNPVTGCKHDCPYCYARDIAERFYTQGFQPAIFPERLDAPANTKIPQNAEQDIAFKNVFTCSMADLFGRWVPGEWVEAVLDEVATNPQWNFLFLTKFPKRFSEFEFPENAWLGTTVDCQARVKAAETAFERVESGTKWLSIEPMLEPVKFTRLDFFDWIVIGGASRSTLTEPWTPPIEWIVDLHHAAREAGCAIYYKTNAGLAEGTRIREYPWQRSEILKAAPGNLQYLGNKSKDEIVMGEVA